MTERKHISATLRRFVRERAAGYCEYCLSQDNFTTEPFVVEHIQPLAAGGKTVLDNLAYACSGCNGSKAAKTSAIDPQTEEVVPLFHPRQQRWHEHFQWNSSKTEIVGITTIGRATIKTLGLNRKPLLNLRRVLVLADEHPPR